MNYSKGESGRSTVADSVGDIDHSVHSRKQGSTMASSVLRFNDISFVVGKGDKKRNLLENVNGKVKWGRKLCQAKTMSCPG